MAGRHTGGVPACPSSPPASQAPRLNLSAHRSGARVPDEPWPTGSRHHAPPWGPAPVLAPARFLPCSILTIWSGRPLCEADEPVSCPRASLHRGQGPPSPGGHSVLSRSLCALLPEFLSQIWLLGPQMSHHHFNATHVPSRKLSHLARLSGDNSDYLSPRVPQFTLYTLHGCISPKLLSCGPLPPKGKRQAPPMGQAQQ